MVVGKMWRECTGSVGCLDFYLAGAKMSDQCVVCFLQKLNSLLNAYGSLSGGRVH